ncbi:MAG: putative nuclease of restriction endonuclease-like (RecB) superfamily [Rickettsiales bacterium]|jgi:predicted nuclease of restriction endonuclease-like (RecB) superfamily
MTNITTDKNFVPDIISLIENCRQKLATNVNSAMTYLYWQVGKRVNDQILKNDRAEYGKQIVVSLSRELNDKFGKGFEERSLRRMMNFAEEFNDEKILTTLLSQLSWSHFLTFITIKDELQRDFYIQMCRTERWSVRTLRKKIDSMLFERTAISRKPDELIKQELEELAENDQLTPDLVFKDPYFLNFTGLKDTYSEKSLEDAILRELESFILELGVGFSFVERQKRMVIDGEDFYLDLLFFHRKLKRLIAIELKIGKFKAAYKGQMELYLRWLEKHEKQESEESPIGLILCAGGNKEQIEFLKLEDSGIKVAEYLTELPDKKVLIQKLHNAIIANKKRIENREEKKC